MKNLLELKRFQIKGSRVNQIYPLTEHSVLYMKSPYKEEICDGNEN